MDNPTQAGESLPSVSAEQLRSDIVAVLRTIYDPELPVNIYDLGLIYNIDISPNGDVAIDMTLTAPGCPVANSFPGEVENRVCEVPGVNSAHVELVWDPPWSMDMLPEETRLELGLL